MCYHTHTWNLPIHALGRHARRDVPALPQPGRQKWIPLSHTVDHISLDSKNSCAYLNECECAHMCPLFLKKENSVSSSGWVLPIVRGLLYSVYSFQSIKGQLTPHTAGIQSPSQGSALLPRQKPLQELKKFENSRAGGTAPYFYTHLSGFTEATQILCPARRPPCSKECLLLAPPVPEDS